MSDVVCTVGSTRVVVNYRILSMLKDKAERSEFVKDDPGSYDDDRELTMFCREILDEMQVDYDNPDEDDDE